MLARGLWGWTGGLTGLGCDRQMGVVERSRCAERAMCHPLIGCHLLSVGPSEAQSMLDPWVSALVRGHAPGVGRRTMCIGSADKCSG